MKLTSDEVRHVADLARLALTDAEIAQYTQQLSDILGYAEILQRVDTSHVPPTPYVLTLENVMRDDVVQPSFNHEQAFLNAPAVENGHFAIPKVMGG